jgi:hypothetical protein
MLAVTSSQARDWLSLSSQTISLVDMAGGTDVDISAVGKLSARD